MAVYLNTGREGSAKTLSTITEIIAKRNESKKDGLHTRKVYYFNILELIPSHPKFEEVNDWIPLTAKQIQQIMIPTEKVLEGQHVLDLDWFDNNSILFIDEAQFLYPFKSSMSAVPEYISFLSLHRHSGLDIYLCTQYEEKLLKLVRKSVKYHKHLTQLGSTKSSNYKKTNDGVLSEADETTISPGRYAFDTDYFGLYVSATDHVDNKNFLQNLKALPLKIKILVPLAVISLFVLIYIINDLLTLDTPQPVVSQKPVVEKSPEKFNSPTSLLSSNKDDEPPVIYLSSILKSRGSVLVSFQYSKSDGTNLILVASDLKAIGYDLRQIREGIYTIDGQVITNAPVKAGKGKQDEKK